MKKKPAYESAQMKKAQKAFTKAAQKLTPLEKEMAVLLLRYDLGLDTPPKYIPIKDTLTKKK